MTKSAPRLVILPLCRKTCHSEPPFLSLLQNKHDSRAMLSLGNFYFSHSSSSKSESQLKESYKFYYHVLNENHNNAYAANGLGMVCVKKNELDVARETFSKVSKLLDLQIQPVVLRHQTVHSVFAGSRGECVHVRGHLHQPRPRLSHAEPQRRRRTALPGHHQELFSFRPLLIRQARAPTRVRRVRSVQE